MTLDQDTEPLDLPAVAATRLVNGMQKVTALVMDRGAVVVTRHDQPMMVLMSLSRYRALERAATVDLDALSDDFDQLLARFKKPDAESRLAAAFAMTPKQLGKAAVAAAKRSK